MKHRIIHFSGKLENNMVNDVTINEDVINFDDENGGFIKGTPNY